jgi:hypothetical protein
MLVSVLCAKADQLAYLTKAQAEEATEFLKEQKQVILWCACCDNDEKKFVTIQSVHYKHTGYENYYQVYILDNKQQTHYLDLAYVHYIIGKKAYCVGKALNYKCDPCTDAFVYNEEVKSNIDILREISEATAYFSQHKDKNSFENFLFQSLPTLDDCIAIFKTNRDAYTYQGTIEDTKMEMKNDNSENQVVADIKVETFTTEDIKKGKGTGGMKYLVDKLNPNITFYEISLLKTKGAEHGISYKYWIKIDNRWVFFQKPWRIIEPSKEQQDAKKKDSEGTIKLVNQDKDPFYVYIDGKIVSTIPGHSTQTFTLEIGSHSVKVVEKSGYILVQQIQTWNVTVKINTTTTISWD